MGNTGNKEYRWLKEVYTPPTTISDYTLDTYSNIMGVIHTIKVNGVDYAISGATTDAEYLLNVLNNVYDFGTFIVVINTGVLTITSLDNSNTLESIYITDPDGFFQTVPFIVSNVRTIVTPTGERKLNLSTDPNYIAPELDTITCPTTTTTTTQNEQLYCSLDYNTKWVLPGSQESEIYLGSTSGNVYIQYDVTKVTHGVMKIEVLYDGVVIETVDSLTSGTLGSMLVAYAPVGVNYKITLRFTCTSVCRVVYRVACPIAGTTTTTTTTSTTTTTLGPQTLNFTLINTLEDTDISEVLVDLVPLLGSVYPVTLASSPALDSATKVYTSSSDIDVHLSRTLPTVGSLRVQVVESGYDLTTSLVGGSSYTFISALSVGTNTVTVTLS